MNSTARRSLELPQCEGKERTLILRYQQLRVKNKSSSLIQNVCISERASLTLLSCFSFFLLFSLFSRLLFLLFAFALPTVCSKILLKEVKRKEMSFSHTYLPMAGSTHKITTGFHLR